jgi:regulator of protease activity HflC (stomatin/prohibitin superfamily)
MLVLVLGIAGLVAGVVLGIVASRQRGGAAVALVVICVLVIATSIFALAALTPVVPGRARVVQLFGRYRGTIRDSGLQWVNPFTRRIAVSTPDP